MIHMFTGRAIKEEKKWKLGSVMPVIEPLWRRAFGHLVALVAVGTSALLQYNPPS